MLRGVKRNALPFKASIRTIGGKTKYFRSKWEANYARYLEYLKSEGEIVEWHHEPKTFWFEGIKRGTVSYLPDFQRINRDGTHEWVEVKGYWDRKSLTKVKRFRKYFPSEKLTTVDGAWFKKNNKVLKLVVNGWE